MPPSAARLPPSASPPTIDARRIVRGCGRGVASMSPPVVPISSRSPVADTPHRALREDRRERPDDRSQIRIAHVVGVRPLAEDAVGGEPRARAAAKNSRVNSAATPAIHGFDGSGHDDVVGPLRRAAGAIVRRRGSGGPPAAAARRRSPFANAAEASTTSGEISTTSARRTMPGGQRRRDRRRRCPDR